MFCMQFSWRSELEDVDVTPFNEPVGPAVPLPANFAGLFQLFFTPALVATIVAELCQAGTW